MATGSRSREAMPPGTAWGRNPRLLWFASCGGTPLSRPAPGRGQLLFASRSLLPTCQGAGVSGKHFDRSPLDSMGSSGMWLEFAVDGFAVFACGRHQFKAGLQAQPEAGRGAGVAAGAQVVWTRVRLTHLCFFGASLVGPCPKGLHAFAVFPAGTVPAGGSASPAGSIPRASAWGTHRSPSA